MMRYQYSFFPTGSPIHLARFWSAPLLVSALVGSVSAGQIAITESTDSKVVISWISPGDDGPLGMAMSYDFRYDSIPITPDNWNYATQLGNSPTPKAGGTPQSFETPRISTSTTWYFAMKTVDEAGNWSDISNIDSAVAHVDLRLDLDKGLSLSQTYAFPNPFRPSAVAEVTFANIPRNSNLLLITISGSVVRRWTDIIGGTVAWNGTNESGNPVASGTYLWFIESTDIKGKLVVDR